MKNKSQGLSNSQTTVIVAMNIIGFAVLFIPQNATELAGVDGAFVTLSAGLVSMFLAGLIVILSSRFPNETVIEYSQRILGKPLGKLYGAVIATHALVVASHVLRGFADAIKVLLLPKTPLEIIMICMLLLCLYCIHGGISTIAKICEIFTFPILSIISITILFNLPEVQMFRFREAFSSGLTPFIKGIPGVSMAYLGYEILFFLIPFMKNKKSALLSGTAGLVLPIFVYTGLVFVAIGLIGTITTSELVYPTIHLSRRVGTSLSFVERFDILFIAFWILAVFTTVTIYLYMSALSFTRLIGLRNYKPFIFMILPVTYILAILPQNIAHINILTKVTNYTGLSIAASSIPLIVLSVIRKKGDGHNG
jgi:spore germination protein